MAPRKSKVNSSTVARPVTLTVSRQYNSSGQEGPVATVQTELTVRRYETAPATVSYELGATMNIGNFESVRVTVGISTPCYREEVEAAYVWAKEFAESRLRVETAEVRAAQHAQSNTQSF